MMSAPTTLPSVTLFAMGGTIAGTTQSRTDTTTYQVGSMQATDLVAAIPELNEIATINVEQVANVESSEIGSELLLKLSRAITAAVDDPRTTGVVVTHGTDTLAESAFFVDITVKSPKPVVFAGAMRPASAISADGPANLLKAVSLAAHPSAAGRGTLISLNDRIGSAFYINKTHSTSLDTFSSDEQGYLGGYVNAVPRFWFSPASPIGKPYFNIDGIDRLPKVAILYGYQDQDESLIDAVIANGAQGIVFAASGHGALNAKVKARVLDLDKSGFPVIRATRTNNGVVAQKPEGIGAGVYTAAKARWLLSLALASGASIEEIRNYFRP